MPWNNYPYEAVGDYIYRQLCKFKIIGLLVSQKHLINNTGEYQNGKEGVGRNSGGPALHDTYNLIKITF